MKFGLAVLLTVAGAMVPARMVCAAAATFEFADGDRVAFVGDEFFERDLDHGYIETQLTTRFPDKHLVFRNLGYAGDTVNANARSLCAGWDNFGPEDQGFDRLKGLVAHLQPTVIFVDYGMNDSFGGEKGLPRFQQGLERMLDMLTGASKARLVLLSPTRHEALPRLADPTDHNRNLGLYVAAISNLAKSRGIPFVDLFTSPTGASAFPLTYDGIRLTPYGYWSAAIAIEQELRFPPRSWHVEMDVSGKQGAVVGTKLSEVKSGDGISFTATDDLLPVATPPGDAPPLLREGKIVHMADQRMLKITGLPPGSYTLQGTDSLTGKGPVQIVTASDEQWAKGVELTTGPAEDRVAELRQTIHAKNLDVFNFWRPENDTYILGYRKGEQGRNAAELPRFEDLAKEKDAEIAKLNHGFAVSYRLSPAK